MLVNGHVLVKRRLDDRGHLRKRDLSAGRNPLSSNQDQIFDGWEPDDLNEGQVIEWPLPDHPLDQLETLIVHHVVD